MNGESTLVPRAKEPSFIAEVWEQARLVFKLLLDPEVPIYLKALPFAAFIYLLLPFDFLPDVIPGLGQLDDLTLILVGAKVFIEMSPQDIVHKYINEFRRQGGYAPVDFDDESSSANLEAEEDDIIDGIIIEGEDTTAEEDA